MVNGAWTGCKKPRREKAAWLGLEGGLLTETTLSARVLRVSVEAEW